MLAQAEGLADQAADAVTAHGAARGLRRDRKADSRPAQIVRARSHGEEFACPAPAARVYGIEIGLPAQAPLRWKGETRLPSRVYGISFRRPLARRRLITRRPPLVAMRARKPCVRLRRTLLG